MTEPNPSEDLIEAPTDPGTPAEGSQTGDAAVSKKPGLGERIKHTLGLDKKPAIKTTDDEEPEEETPETSPPTPSPQEARPKDKIESHEWAFRRAVSGEIRDTKTGEVIMSPDTIVDFGPEWELALYQKIDTLMSVIGDQATLDVVMQDKHFSRYTEVVRELYSASWRGNAIAEEWKVLSSEKDSKKRKKLIAALEGKHIFKTLDQAMHAYGFVEQCEAIIVRQMGHDATLGGKRNLVLDLEPQKIETLMKEEIPSEIRKKLGMLVDIVRNHPDRTAAISVLLTEVGGFLASHNLFRLETPEALAVGAIGAAGVAVGYGIPRGIFKLIELDKGEKGRTVKLELQFNPLPGGPLDEGLNNPIAQYFAGKGQTAEGFLGGCDEMRLQIARCLGFDWEETPPALSAREYQDLFQMDLSSENLGLDTRGFTLRHRLLVAAHLPRILSTEYLKPDGIPKRFEELSTKEQRDVIERVYDMASLDYGGAELRAVSAQVAKRMAMGEKVGKRDAREGVYKKLATDLRSGKTVLHHKEGEENIEDMEKRLVTLQTQRDRQTAGETTYIDLLQQIKTVETTLEEKRKALERTRREKGAEVQPATATVPAISASGEIGAKRAEIERLQTRAEELKNEVGVERADGTFTGLLGRQMKIGAELGAAKIEERTRGKILSEKRERLQRLKQIPLDQIDDSDPKKQQLISEISVLESSSNAGGVKVVEKRYQAAQKKRAELEERYRQVTEMISGRRSEIKEIEGKGGAITQAEQEMLVAQKAISQAEEQYDEVQKSLLLLIDQRNVLLRDVFSIDSSAPDFQIPSEATIGEKIKQTSELFEKLNTEIAEFKEKKKKGEVIASEEDLKIADVLENIVAQVVTDTRLNSIVQKFIDGEINLEELRKTKGDEIYRVILEEVFGPDALMEGAGGKYHIVRRLISKSMMVEKAIELWRLEERIDDFFADSPQLRANYATFRRNLSEIEKYRGEIDVLERTPEAGWETRANQLRREITKLTAANENLLESVFNQKIAPLLCQDRGRTAVFVRVLIDDLDKRSRVGNPFGEIVSKAGKISDRETIRTPDGTVTLVRAARDPDTGVLLNRGAAIFEQANARVSVNIGAGGPVGDLQAEIIINKTDEAIARMPVSKVAAPRFPPEIGFFVYDVATGNRRSIQEINAFIDGLGDEASIRTAAVAEGADPDVIAGMLFVAGRKRSSSEIRDFTISYSPVILQDIAILLENLEKLGPGFNLNDHFIRALGQALIENNKFHNRELLSNYFTTISKEILELGGAIRFPEFDEFNIQNDDGELAVYYKIARYPEIHSIPASRLIKGEEVPFLGNPLSNNQINAILEMIARIGFEAMRFKS